MTRHTWLTLGLCLVGACSKASANTRQSPTPSDAKPAARVQAPSDRAQERHVLREHLSQPASVRWMRAAELLLNGTEACVDGRDGHAVLGTPGGDAGELLLSLATLENMSHDKLSDAHVRHVFAAHLESFGRFYLHTDRHALDALANKLRSEGIAVPDDAEAWLRHPPADVRQRLLELLVKPDFVGCGHLKLVLQHPRDYGVRRDLTETLLRLTFEALWSQPQQIDFVVLEGQHEERAVVNIHVDQGDIHAFTNVPAISPRVGKHSIFVAHPQVTAFVRDQHAHFLWDTLPEFCAHEKHALHDVETYKRGVQRLADHQLDLTLKRLAPTLPVFDVAFSSQNRALVNISSTN